MYKTTFFVILASSAMNLSAAYDNQYSQSYPAYATSFPEDSKGSDQSNNNNRQRNPQEIDQTISQKVHETLSPGWFSRGYEKVTYQVQNGTVLLRGFVNNEDDLRDINEKISKINGVRNIENQIIVQMQNPNQSRNTAQYQYQNPQNQYQQGQRR